MTSRGRGVADDADAPEVAPVLIGPVRLGPIAHGGHCVARHDGRVIFVRHGLPDEQVMIRLTDQSKKSFWRGDAVDILESSPDRVVPPCPIAGPGRCGGCDFQHVDLAAQRRLKAEVVAEQLQRMAGIEWSGTVEALDDPSPGPDGLGWRTRMRYQVDDHGRAGLRGHRSREVVALPEQGCLIADPRTPEVVGRAWPPDTELITVATSTGQSLIADRRSGTIEEHAAGRDFTLDADGFWQVHPAAADTLVAAVLAGLRPEPGERAFDLYCGVGLFAGALADAGCQVWGVEGSRRAIQHARLNLSDAGRRTRFTAGLVERVLHQLPDQTDLVVLDPPRSGAGRAVITDVIARRPRAIAYVACDPAALARDLATAIGLGYRPSDIRAFDLFPMTHHVECVAVLHPSEQVR